MLIAPLCQGEQNRPKSESGFGRQIFGPTALSGFAIGSRIQQSVTAEVFQTCRQYAARYTELSLKVIKSPHTKQNGPQYQQRPFVADNVDRVRQVAAINR